MLENMKSLSFIIGGLVTCWVLTDPGSGNPLTATLAPIGVILFIIALAYRLLLNTRPENNPGGDRIARPIANPHNRQGSR